LHSDWTFQVRITDVHENLRKDRVSMTSMI
jgi:hypothetical protein